MLDARPGLVLRCDWLVALLWHAQPSYWLVAGPAHREGCVVSTNNLGYQRCNMTDSHIWSHLDPHIPPPFCYHRHKDRKLKLLSSPTPIRIYTIQLWKWMLATRDVILQMLAWMLREVAWCLQHDVSHLWARGGAARYCVMCKAVKIMVLIIFMQWGHQITPDNIIITQWSAGARRDISHLSNLDISFKILDIDISIK